MKECISKIIAGEKHDNDISSDDLFMQCVWNCLCRNTDKKPKSKDDMPDYMYSASIRISGIYIDHHIFCLGSQRKLKGDIYHRTNIVLVSC